MVNKEKDYHYCLDFKESIFSSLSLKEKDILMKGHASLFYKKGEIIYREGEIPTGLICLSAGKVKIIKEVVGGRYQIMRMVKPVGFIGYRALFANQSYRGTALAIESCVVVVLNKANVYKVLKSNGDLATNFLNLLASELGHSNNRTVTLTQKHIRGRLADAIKYLVDTFGLEDDDLTLKVYLSREDLASLANMTTSNAIRTLGNFVSEEVLFIEGRKIKILNQSQLQRISELG